LYSPFFQTSGVKSFSLSPSVPMKSSIGWKMPSAAFCGIASRWTIETCGSLLAALAAWSEPYRSFWV